MSDEIEDISVVETTVETVAGTEPVALTVESPTEELPAEIEATQINLAPADDILTQNAQQAYAEQYMPDRAGGATPITAAGHAAKAVAEDDKKSDLIEHLEQSERRKDWLERDHDFGGTKMSGHDLAKMIDFISNPQMQDKLRERLGKSGVPKEKIDKGMKELNEYIDLKKKEQDGGKLSEEQHRRLKELEKSEEFRVVAQEAVRVAQERGVPIKPIMIEAQTKSLATAVHDSARMAEIDKESIIVQAKATQVAKNTEEDDMLVIDEGDKPTKNLASVVTPVTFVAASARENFAGTPSLTEKFGVSSALPVAAQYSDPKLTMVGQTNEDDGVGISSNQFSAKMPLAMGSARA